MKNAAYVASACLALSLAATPAHATTAQSEQSQRESPRAIDPGGPGNACYAGDVCFFQHRAFRGSHHKRAGLSWVWPPWIIDQDSSVINAGTSGKKVRVYKWIGHKRPSYCVYRGSKVLHLKKRDLDNGASHRWTSNASNCY